MEQYEKGSRRREEIFKRRNERKRERKGKR
jgi:hypothetical protein